MKNINKAAIVAATLVTSLAASASDGYYVAVGINENAVIHDTHAFVDIKDTATKAVYKLKEEGLGFSGALGKREGKFSNEIGIEKLGTLKWTNEERSLRIKNIGNLYYNGYIFMPVIVPQCEAFAKGGISYISERIDHQKEDVFALNYGAGIQATVGRFSLRGSYTKVIPTSANDDLTAFTDNLGLDLVVNII